MTFAVATPGMPNAVADVEARIGAIQARIDGLVGAAPGRAAPVFDLALADDPADADEPATEASQPAAPASAPAASTPSGPVDARLGATVQAPGQVSAPSTTDARGSVLAARLPEHGRHLASAIEDAAVRSGIEPSLLAALVRHESNFRQGVVSHAGAIGLAQLMPGTAAGLGVDPNDPSQNLDGGARYLREQLDRFGSPELALAAYNAGPNRVAQAGGIPRITETETYVGRVMSTWEQYR